MSYSLELLETQQERDALSAERDAYREALEYYADESKYISHGRVFGVCLERGEKARSVLAKFKRTKGDNK